MLTAPRLLGLPLSPSPRIEALEVVTTPDDAAMKPSGMHRQEGPAGQRGSLFKGPDAAGRPGLASSLRARGGGRHHASSGSFRVVPATLPLAFLAWLARHPSRGAVGYCYDLLVRLAIQLARPWLFTPLEPTHRDTASIPVEGP